jgi:hypothetical protein
VGEAPVATVPGAIGPSDRAEPGIIETSLVLGLAFLLAVGILVFFGGPVADIIGLVVDAAHQGR